jgi:hypothetical protein
MAAPRRFDHDEARRRYAAGESQPALAREYGVSVQSVFRVVTPNRQRVLEHEIDYQRRRLRVPCPGGCGAVVWKRSGRIPLCPVCTGKARRKVEHGTPGRYRRGCHCDVCRAAATADRRERRERRKIPCTKCGRPRMHPNDIGPNREDTGLCIECFVESVRKVA